MADDKKNEPADQPVELSDDQAEEASGGAAYMKFDGVDGRVQAQPDKK